MNSTNGTRLLNARRNQSDIRALLFSLFMTGIAAFLIVTVLSASPSLGRGGPKVRVKPSVIAIGGKIKVRGYHFYAKKKVTLYIGVPNSEGMKVGSKRTNKRGSFKKSLKLSSSIDPGKYVVLACQRSCRTKATKSFRITVTGR